MSIAPLSTVGVSLRSGRPLAPMQRALWMSQRLHPTAPVQNMALLTHIDGPVDAERLATAFETVVESSDILRTRIHDDGGTPLVSLDAKPQDREIIQVVRADAQRWAEARVSSPIDTAIRGYDSAILVHEDQTVSWYLDLHHTITDATSSALVFEATAEVYHGQPVELGSYYRWASTQGEMASEPARSKRISRAMDHWRHRQAAQPLDRLYRPLRRPAPAATRIRVDLDDELNGRAAAALADEYRMLSPDLGWSALLMTASAVYLSSLSGADSFAIGLPVHNRTDPETHNLIGPIMEVFPVDIEVDRSQTFRSLHRNVGRAILTTLANAVPGAAPAADYAAVVNVIARAGVGKFGSYPSTTTWVHSGAIDSSHLLRVQFTAYDQTMALDINRAGADDRHLDHAGGHFRSIVAAMVADPDQLINGPSLDDVELVQLASWESTPDFETPTIDIVSRLEAALVGHHATSLTDGDLSVSGAELWNRVVAVAGWLRRRGIGPGHRVGIELSRSADAVIAILATLVAGGSFVPLDPAQPERRRRRLAERAGIDVVVTNLPTELDQGANDRSDRIFPAIDPDQEAYLLFTSGSTGEPKGVPITHRGLSRYLRFALESYTSLEAADRPIVPLFSSLNFDLTITSLFLPLLAGGEAVVIRADGPAGLSAVAAEERINWCKATPSHLEILTRLLPQHHSLRTIVVGGEAFGPGLAKRLLAWRDDLAIFNEYGPTEAVVGCMIHRVAADRLDEHQEVPIGAPAPGVTLRIVGSDTARQPFGTVGELAVGHPGLTNGYLDPTDPELDGGSPFVEIDGGCFYRTGDLVRLTESDGAVYLGRIDEQVKVGGIRLEPTEVEAALRSHPAVSGAAVRLWSPSAGSASASAPKVRCVRCGLASNVPGVEFDSTGLCGTCHEYDRVAPQVEAWFRTPDDLISKRDSARSARAGDYDCLHLLSGGKDSTYALYRLIDLGFEPYVLTLDNGFISPEAIDNVRRTIGELGLDHTFATTEAMNDIFRDSLERHSTVCHGCYKTLYTLATTKAVELGIPIIVTGLSRGQLFETRLLPRQFRSDRFDPDAIDRAVIEARRAYHRMADGPNQLLDTSVFADDELFERIEYLDFYRYVDVELAELYGYLEANAPWVRPSDTGRSTNCLINAAGIAAHIEEQGYHNYAIPYAWDVRLGHKTRTEAIEELEDDLDRADVERMLAEVGYTPNPVSVLTAWIETKSADDPPTPAALRAYLSEALQPHAIPRAFVNVEALPLTTNGKLDTARLPGPQRTHRTSTGVQIAAETELEATIVGIWEQTLQMEPVGVDDDFFALGGDSLAALEMSVAVADATGAVVRDDLAFLHTTPRDLAAAIDQLNPSLEPGPVAPDPEDGSPRPSGPWSLEHPPPLSDGERSILYEQARRPDDVMYNVGRLYRVQGALDVDRFVAALHTVAACHIPLSWTYSTPRRLLSPQESVHVDRPLESGSHLSPLSEQELGEAARRFHRAPLDPADGPLLKAFIRPVDDGSTAVLLVCHHVSGDAESFERLWPQIDAVYNGQTFDPPPIDYPSFTSWQRSGDTGDERLYWLDQGEQAESSGALAIDVADTAGQDGFITIDASVSPRQLKARTSTSAFATAVAALAATLRRYRGYEAPVDTGPGEHDSVSLGMIASARNHTEAEPLVGYFLNVLPLDLSCSPDDELGDLVARASGTIAANLTHRSYPYARIIADRREAGVPPGEPEVLVVYEKLLTASFGVRPVHQTVLSPGAAVADATFFVEERDDRIGLGLEYRGSFLDDATARRLLADFDTMLSAAVENSKVAVADVALPSCSGSFLVGDELEAPRSLLPAIEAHLVSDGRQVAVECGGTAMTWRELGRRVDELAHSLTELAVGPGDRVLVQLNRSTDLVAAVVATLRVGAAYVPVDPTYPADRIDLITGQAGAAAAFVNDGDRAALVANTDRVEHDADETRADAADTAYVIFTSGSTGRPRGVPVSHAQLAASTAARDRVYDEPPLRFLLLSSASFDSSIVGLFWTLSTGGTIVMPTEVEIHDPDALLKLFDGASIDHTLLVPTLYSALLDRGESLAGWPRHVIVAGEACPPNLVERHFRLRPEALLTNEYGPTEATVWATAHRIAPGDQIVPIGPPIPGSWLAVADERDQPLPEGVSGQLLIGGAGVVDGYDNDDCATSERFGEVDGGGRFFRTGDRARIVDSTVRFLGRLDDQLNLGGIRVEPEEIERVLLSDPAVAAAIVSIQDRRSLADLIEGAVASTLGSAMHEAAAAADPAADLKRRLRGAGGGAPRLVAHLEPSEPDVIIDIDRVRALARQELPALLRPASYAVHATLPRLPNGKLDRTAAAELEPDASVSNAAVSNDRALGESANLESNDAGGRRDLEQELVGGLRALFADTVGTDRVGPTDSFFDLGGHSLMAMELLGAIEDRFDVDVTVPSLYDHPTPASMARLIASLQRAGIADAQPIAAQRSQGDQRRFLIPIQPSGSLPPIFAVHVLGVNCEYFRPLAARLGVDQPMYGLGQPTLDLDTSLPTSVHDIARLYRDELIQQAPDGPVVLAAVSLGAVVAYELAQQLAAVGREVALLALFDAAGPTAEQSAPNRAERLAIHRQELTAHPGRYARERAFHLREVADRRREILGGRLRRSVGLRLTDRQRIRRFIEDNWRSQFAYEHQRYDGAVAVFKAGDDPFTASMASDAMGWQSVVTGPLDVAVTPGGHLSMLAEPDVETLATNLRRAIAAAIGAASKDPVKESPKLGFETVEANLTDALYRGRFGPTVARRLVSLDDLDVEARRLLSRADETTKTIARDAIRHGAAAVDALHTAGREARLEPVGERLTHLSVRIRIGENVTEPQQLRQQVTEAARILEGLGYRHQHVLSPGAWHTYLRTSTSCTMLRTDESTTRVVLTWGDKPTEGPWHPGRADLGAVALPRSAWPLYYAIRPARLAIDRVQQRTGRGSIIEQDLGVFLGTPTSMIADILAVADPGPGDLVVDIGCGDGRVLIEAVRAYGCQARGVENDPGLAELAKNNVAEAGFQDRIEIVEADATSKPGRRALAGASIVFLFLPPETTGELLGGVLQRLGPGGRVVAHEQLGYKWPTEPDVSRLIIGSGITVAHLWRS